VTFLKKNYNANALLGIVIMIRYANQQNGLLKYYLTIL